MRRALPFSLLFVLGLYALLAHQTVRQVGVVGEVTAAWGLESPPRVVVGWEDGEEIWADGHRLGPLVASQVRPTERLELGGFSLPLTVNQYTGGLADWPARWVYGTTGSKRLVVGLHVALGGLLIVLCFRFLRFHGSTLAAGLCALALSADWSFLFYRKVLGGTEILLQAAALLTLWALWSRRWAGGRHGSRAIGLGLGLGLLAKATFLPTIAALGLASLVTRRDRPEMRAPEPLAWRALLGIPLLCCVPFFLAWGHHALVDWSTHVVSHDFLGLQVERALDSLRAFAGGGAPAREPPQTLLWYLLSPLNWFEVAYGADIPKGLAPWRLVGLGVLVLGTWRCWRLRRQTPAAALLRFLSIFVPLQLVLLWVCNRDLHHLAQATPTLCLWLGLGAAQLAVTVFPPHSMRGAVLGLALVLPWTLAGARMLSETDPLLASIKAPQFHEEGQQSLEDLLRQSHVESIWTSDYDLYGMLDMRLPELEITHAWGAVSHRFRERDKVLAELLQGAQGSHYLVIRPSAPLIYNLAPSEDKLLQIAEPLGIQIRPMDSLSDAGGTWATLYAVY